MFNILDLEKTKRYINSTYSVRNRFVPGYMCSCVMNDTSGEKFHTVSEFRERLGFPKLYLDRGKDNEILECAFVKDSEGRLYIVYDIKFGTDAGDAIMCSNVISSGDKMNPQHWNPIVFESDSEKQAEELLRKWNSIKKEISEVTEFLDDPWAGYRAKEKSYKEKLVKCKAATENEILLKKVRLKDLKKELEELEEKFIPGTKENREGN